MKKKTRKNIHDDDKPIGKLSAIADFLPPPHELMGKEQNVKITIALDEETIKFFKHEALTHHTKYQKMMREVLKGYARKYGS